MPGHRTAGLTAGPGGSTGAGPGVPTVDQVLLVPVAVVIGVVVGRIVAPGGGRRRALPWARLPGLLVAGVLATALAGRLGGDTALAVAIAGRLALLIGVLANLHVTGAGVVAAGLALNLAPLAVDGATPVRRGALVQAGVVDAAEVERVAFDGPRRLERPDDALAALGDVVPLDPAATVVSIGDIVIATGVADVALHLVRRRGRARRPSSSVAAPARRRIEPSSRPGPLRRTIGTVDPATWHRIDLRPPGLSPLVATYRRASSAASPVQDWGTAPPGAAVSACHHSAQPDATAPTVAGRATVATGAPAWSRR